MSEAELDAGQIERKVHDLAEAMERVRNDRASQDDVVVEMKQVARSRLELLAGDLQPLFADIPDGNEQFEFALTNGEPPRLWIDMTSFVRMGRDRHVYEFVKDTRMGRILLGSSDDRERIGKIVSNYVAERMVEREQMIEGEWVAMRNYDFDTLEETTAESEGGSGQTGGLGKTAGWFLLGIIAGGASALAWVWYFGLPQFLQSVS